jgi:hypothetical protein
MAILIDGKIWNVCHKIEQGGGLSSVAYVPPSPRCNRHKPSKPDVARVVMDCLTAKY